MTLSIYVVGVAASPVTARKTKAFTLAAETDAALAVGGVKARQIIVAAETDSAGNHSAV